MSHLSIDLNNLDKSEWKTYRFDEIAKNISERVDPNNTDLTVYIGLEHLDSGSIHIKRHGSPDDVNGQKLKFYKGDVIFGRRRAYQRKAGIATWDGFCSAHALVLRANPDVIDAGLFPFFLHSDLFMNRAVDISVGSLSPTINWGTLKHQEFVLPPMEFQKRFKHFLQACQNMIVSGEKLGASTKASIAALQKDIFSSDAQVELDSIFEITTGFPYKSKLFNEEEKGFKLMRGINIKEGEFLWEKDIDRYYDGKEGLDEKFKVCDGDILVPMDGSKLGLNYAQASKNEQGTLLVQRIASFRSNDENHKLLLLAFLGSQYFQKFVEKNNTTTAIPHVSLKQLKAIKLPELSDKLFVKLNLFKSLVDIRFEAEQSVTSKKQLKRTIVNKVF